MESVSNLYEIFLLPFVSNFCCIIQTKTIGASLFGNVISGGISFPFLIPRDERTVVHNGRQKFDKRLRMTIIDCQRHPIAQASHGALFCGFFCDFRRTSVHFQLTDVVTNQYQTTGVRMHFVAQLPSDFPAGSLPVRAGHCVSV